MVVLVAGQRESVPLDRIGDKAGRPIVVRSLERFNYRFQVMAGEIRHQRMQVVVVMALDQRRCIRIALEVLEQAFPPRSPALEGQRRIEVVRTPIDPLDQGRSPGLLFDRLQQLSVLERDHPPAHRLEQSGNPGERTVCGNGVEALAVVIDDPPAVSQPALGAVEQGFVHVAFVELRVSEHGHHAAGRVCPGRQVMIEDVVLHQRSEQRHGTPKADGPRGKIDVVRILRARGIALCSAISAECLQVLASLAPLQVLDRMEHRACMGLHGHPVLGPQDVEVQGRQQRHHGGRGSLVPPNLQTVQGRAEMVRMVNGPRRQPSHLALQRTQLREVPLRRLRFSPPCLGQRHHASEAGMLVVIAGILAVRHRPVNPPASRQLDRDLRTAASSRHRRAADG